MSNLRFRTVLVALIAASCSAVVCCAMFAETPGNPAILALKPVPQTDRIAPGASLTPQLQLTGHLPGWITPDRQTTDSVDLSAPLRVSIVLSRAPNVQAAFESLLTAQTEPGSPFYRQWMTPQQVGELFGPTSSDLAAVTSWLTAQGLKIEQIAPSGVIIDVSGSTAAFATAFHSGFAYYTYAGKARLSTMSEPSIPAALAPVMRSIMGLTDVPMEPMSHMIPVAGSTNPEANGGAANTPKPLLSLTNGSHYVTPADFATIYDINSVYNGGNTGATLAGKAQHVAIVGRSRVSATDISEWETNTALPSNVPNTIIPPGGVDPGPVCTFANQATCSTGGDQGEATLDVDRVIGTAPGSTVDLIIATNASGGISLAAQYNINTLLDPVMNLSFGACEKSAGLNNVNFWDTLFATANSEGITVFVASGDSGAAGCEPYNATPTATYEYTSINYICATSHVTCAGGTEFAEGAGNYWSTSNSTGYESALSYIPEGAWNEPSTTASGVTTYYAQSTGGGPSIYITKPSWQTGTGVPNDGFRDTPDISLSSAGHDGYYTCLDYDLQTSTENCTAAGGGYFFYFYGTSGAAPGMAGITALLNTAVGKSQGNLNATLYPLAASTPAAFHDATPASSGIGSGCTTATPSICNNSIPTSSSLTGGTAGYALTTGYDESTGLGSLDVAKFIAALSPVPTSLALTSSANPTTTGTGVTYTAKLTPGTSSNTPTGTVQFYVGGVAFGSAITIVSNSATSATQTYTTAGTYSITAIYSGDSNFLTSSASALPEVVNSSTAPTFSVTPVSTAVTVAAGATAIDSITLASVNAFVGTVTITCTPANVSGTATGTCALVPSSAALTSGGSVPSVLSITSTASTCGTFSAIVTGTSGTTVVKSATITATVACPSFTLTPASSSQGFTSGATQGNTDLITLTSVAGFTSSAISMTCTLTVQGAPTYPATCSMSPTSVAIATAGGTATSTLTINSTVAHALPGQGGRASLGWRSSGGAVLATLLCLLLPRRRRVLRGLAVCALLVFGLAAISGCSKGSTTVTNAPTLGSSAGAYTVTVTGTSGTTVVTSIPITLTIN